MSTEWLEEMYAHVAAARLEDAIDLLFERVDDALCVSDFAGVDDMLPALDLRRLDSNLLIGVLSVTLAAKSVLQKRPALVTEIEASLMETDAHRIDRLMSGLR